MADPFHSSVNGLWGSPSIATSFILPDGAQLSTEIAVLDSLRTAQDMFLSGQSTSLPMFIKDRCQAGCRPTSDGESVTGSLSRFDYYSVETDRPKLGNEPVAQDDNVWQQLRDPFSNLARGYHLTRTRTEREKSATIPLDERRRRTQTCSLMERAELQSFVRPEFHIYYPGLKKLSGYIQKTDLRGFLPDHTRIQLEERTQDLLDRILCTDGPENIDHLTGRWLNEVVQNITLAWESEMEKGRKDTILLAYVQLMGARYL